MPIHMLEITRDYAGSSERMNIAFHHDLPTNEVTIYQFVDGKGTTIPTIIVHEEDGTPYEIELKTPQPRENARRVWNALTRCGYKHREYSK